MNKEIHDIILKATEAENLCEEGIIQSLWSGYGNIIRYRLFGAKMNSIVVKHVKLPEQTKHPRGWNTDLSHERKIKSYKVETAWYEHWAKHCDDGCRIPDCLALEHLGDEVVMVLEDLDETGFPERKTSVTENEIHACLSWLANFHATFMGILPKHLWDIGTYWHLDTRPDEFNAIEDKSLKMSAQAIDKKLNECNFLTFVHGDAKLANFCFSNNGKQVAAVDFQYVGGGCGMKDVAYFIGSCLDEGECEQQEPQLLDFYFTALGKALRKKNSPFDIKAIEEDWRQMYPYAWTDFHRFLKGWSPAHWKINSYSERLAAEVVKEINTPKKTKD